MAAGRGDELSRQGSGFVTIAVPRVTQASRVVTRDDTFAILGHATSSPCPQWGVKCVGWGRGCVFMAKVSVPTGACSWPRSPV